MGAGVKSFGTTVVALGLRSSDPSGAADGAIYYNTTSNKLRTKQNGSWVDAVTPAIIAAQAISGTSIDWATGNVFTKTLSANTTFTFSNQASGQTIVVRLTNTASNYTVTWPGSVLWSGGTAPVQTIGAKSDVYTFVYDGSSIYGSVVQDF